jgi:hypothetical protein
MTPSQPKTPCLNWGSQRMNMLVAIFTQFQDEEEIELSVHNGQRHGAVCASLMVPYSALLDAGLPF